MVPLGGLSCCWLIIASWFICRAALVSTTAITTCWLVAMAIIHLMMGIMVLALIKLFPSYTSFLPSGRIVWLRLVRISTELIFAASTVIIILLVVGAPLLLRPNVVGTVFWLAHGVLRLVGDDILLAAAAEGRCPIELTCLCSVSLNACFKVGRTHQIKL